MDAAQYPAGHHHGPAPCAAGWRDLRETRVRLHDHSCVFLVFLSHSSVHLEYGERQCVRQAARIHYCSAIVPTKSWHHHV